MATAPTTPRAREGTTLNERLLAFFSTRPDAELDVGAIWEGLGSVDQRPTLVTSLSVLSRKGAIVRSRPGVYRLAKAGESAAASAGRAAAAKRADAAERGEVPAVKAGPKARSVTSGGESGSAAGGRGGSRFTVLSSLKDGRLLLESPDGTLWAAVQLVEGRR